MSLTFGEKIKEARKQKGLTQKQLANLIGAAHNSISDWENDKNKPDPDMIELLCGALEITPNYLLASTEDSFSPKEKLLIEKYRIISENSPEGAKVVNTVLDREHSVAMLFEKLKKYVKNEDESENDSDPYDMQQEDASSAKVRYINYYHRLASAGTGQIIFDTPPTKRIEIPDTAENKKAAYAISVDGNSMEPVYHDGDTLLIEMTDEIQRGDIGIFLVNGESFVKKLGDGELISLNPSYENIPLTEDSKCMGKVLSVLE